MHNFKKVYCDFDGTISKTDSVYTFLKTHAHPIWLEDEKLWQMGKISSKECLIRQVKALPKIDAETLENYIKSIEIDEYFIEFHSWLKSNGVELVILSDGFDSFIKRALEKYGLCDIKYFANTLVYANGEFKINFHNHNKNCDMGAGSCKCSKVEEEDFCYIGDGTSDICIARKARKLFAKNNLKIFCDEMKLEYVQFNTFKDILDNFKEGQNNEAFNKVNQ